MNEIASRKNRNAFTLTELLVVVAIIGGLMALLLPMMKKAMEMTRQTKCASNLKQIGVAMNLFASDNNERYPAAFGDSMNTVNLTWMWQLKSYLGLPENSMGMSPLPRAAGVLICPSLKQVTVRDASYAENNFMTSNSGRIWRYSRLTIPQSTTIIIAEISANADAYSPISGGPVTRRHPGPSANYLFADSHVETFKELIPASDKRWEPDL
ncbi:MAG: hypothetical protein B9S32_02840 [Verrucomicrobia bacterium Tous-C9LFEB]|nr:MAG: hypothetical protein B9S32_02840 [Verrucomicrobia bacterium Tous-C9LFEB]